MKILGDTLKHKKGGLESNGGANTIKVHSMQVWNYHKETFVQLKYANQKQIK
jgi:hypothetical protein